MIGYVSITGIDELVEALETASHLGDDIKKIVHHRAGTLDRAIKIKANFTHGYATGTTKRSIHSDVKDGGFTAIAGPTTEYAPYLEYGTRFMDAQPFVRPAFDQQKVLFETDIRRAVKRALKGKKGINSMVGSYDFETK